MLPQTDNEGNTSRDGARRCSSSREKAERSLNSSGDEREENDERSREASIIDSEGGLSDDLGKKLKNNVLKLKYFFKKEIVLKRQLKEHKVVEKK